MSRAPTSGPSVVAPNGKLVSVFGDTFSGRKVGQGDWRSPVVLIGTGDADHEIVYERAGGDDPNYARQLWHYIHDDASTGWTRGGISTVIPSDLLCVDDSIYLHAIVNRGFGNVIWTEIWRSDDSGISWAHMGEDAKFPGRPARRLRPVLVVGLRARRRLGVCGGDGISTRQGHHLDARPARGHRAAVAICQLGLRRRPLGVGKPGHADHAGRREVGRADVSPDGARQMGSRRIPRIEIRAGLPGRGLARRQHAHHANSRSPWWARAWHDENHSENKVAQLYGGYVLPGSRFDIAGRYRPGGVTMEHRRRMALPGNAIQSRDSETPRRRTRPPDPINL